MLSTRITACTPSACASVRVAASSANSAATATATATAPARACVQREHPLSDACGSAYGFAARLAADPATSGARTVRVWFFIN
jgi:hypothetical protein